MKIHDPPNTNPRIDTLWAVISVDSTGEGVVAAQVGGSWMTLTTSEERLMPMLRQVARDLASKTGKRLKLIKLTTREDVEDIGDVG